MAVSTRTRFEIFKRDNYRCHYCGATPLQSALHIDHVVATANGGTDDPSNLITACKDCNLRKHAKTEYEFLVQGHRIEEVPLV